MMDGRRDILALLERLDLSEAEAVLYYELTRWGSLTHLQLSRRTGISRTRVYRVADSLIQRGLVAQLSDDSGKALTVTQPENLELGVILARERLLRQATAYSTLQPLLVQLAGTNDTTPSFSIRTHDGAAGFKQMLWNELQATGELLVFGDGTLEDLVGSRSWAERQRAKTVERKYYIREIANSPLVPTANRDFAEHITTRRIDPAVLPLQHQIVIYNETVSIYCWRDGQKTGLEVLNDAFAGTMRAMFELYWGLAKESDE